MSNLPSPIPTPVNEETDLNLRLSSIVKEARNFVDELDPVVKKFELQPTEILFGLSGGLILGLLTFLLMTVYYTGNLAIISTVTPISIIIGILLPMIFFRGRSQWKLEKNIKLMKTRLIAIRSELVELNKIQRAPSKIREEMWSAYQDAFKAFEVAMREVKSKK